MFRKFRLTPGMFIRMAADGVLVASALALAVGLRLLYTIAFQDPPDISETTRRDMLGYLVAVGPVVLFSLVAFWFSGFYTYSRQYLSRYKVLVVLRAVTLGYLAYGFLSFFVYGHLSIARGALPLGWLLSAVMLIGSRVWSDVWRSTVAPEKENLLRGRDRLNHVLVIGGGGYIGSALIPRLLDQGYRVRLLDVLLFGEEPIAAFANHPNLEIVCGDFRDQTTVLNALDGVDAVVHLGAIVGDPACKINEDLSISVNLVSTRVIAELAKAAGVRRFVFASTCSVYGASDDLLDERSALRPLSLYGHTKLASERVLQEIGDEQFQPTILRFATIYGFSGRTRFDLVINLMTAKAKIDGEFFVHGGKQWRPFIHVQDAAKSIAMSLEASLEDVGNRVFNVGANEQNHTILDVAKMVHQHVLDAKLTVSEDMADHRNYRVAFDKIHKTIGFEPDWTVHQGIQQVLEAIASGEITNYESPKYSNVRFLTEGGTGQLARDQWARQMIDSITERPLQQDSVDSTAFRQKT